MKVGRNDPCPCGSGKKHKNCCLARSDRDLVSPADGLATAFSWLQQHHRIGFARAVTEFYAGAGLDEAQLDRLARLPDGLQGMVAVNATEWLLAEGEIETRGERRRAVDLVLGAGGPPLSVEARRWLEGLARHPLGLYEVQESVPGEGVWIRDATTSEAQRLWVTERTASQRLARWDVLGARLMPVGEGWQFSGAVYPIPRNALFGLSTDLRAAERAGDRPSGPIVACWLRQLTAPPARLPELVDAASGEPLLMVTDHYEVADWEELAGVLARQPDVSGDREDGWVWLEQADGGSLQRSRLSLNPGKGNGLEVFARTLRRAEEGAAWLGQVAGHTLTYRTREIVDPLAVLAQGPPATSRPAPASIPLPPEIHRELYRRWPDEPIPALGHLTPRQALRTRAGRLKVIELLKEYELDDRRSAREQGREPADWAFLWDELGLAPP